MERSTVTVAGIRSPVLRSGSRAASEAVVFVHGNPGWSGDGVMPGYRWHRMARLWRMPSLGELVMASTTRVAMKLAMRHANPRSLPESYLEEMCDNFELADAG